MTDTSLQGTAHDLSDEARRAIARARKILDMASRPPQDGDTPAQVAAKEAERAVAAEKFQAILLEYNLSQAMIEQAGGEVDGRREDKKLKAGVYEWQRNLWEAVAELNFCLYFCQDTWHEREVRAKRWDGSVYKVKRYTRGKEHRLVGKVVNVTAAQNLCLYIEAAIERLVRERLTEINPQAKLHTQLFTRYAVSFREGAADDVIRRVNEARREAIRADKQRVAEARARQAENAASGVSDSTAIAITIQELEQKEEDANYDVLYGEGWSAEQRAKRQARAEAAAEEERRYAEWAKANPEEAARREKEAREENERYWRRRNANYRGGPAPKERDHTAYRSGGRAGASIGLDIQAGGSKAKGALS